MTSATLYLEQFSHFDEMLKVDVKAYKAALEQRKAGLKELLGEVKLHRGELDLLDKRFV